MKSVTITFQKSAFPRTHVVFFIGKLDEHSCDGACKKVNNFYRKNKAVDTLVLDFSNLLSLNSKAIGQIMELSNILSQEEKRLIISGPSLNVLSVLDMLGVRRTLEIVKSLEEVKSSIVEEYSL